MPTLDEPEINLIQTTKVIPARSDDRNVVLISLAAGACAGALAKSFIAPLDRTKIMFQVSKTPFSYAKAVEILTKSYRKHGFSSWWRGNSATVARVAPYAAIQFTAHEQIKKLLGSVRNEALPPVKRFLAGSLAGCSAAILTYPLDMIRARMAVSGPKKYSSLSHSFNTIYKEEGILTFYNGFVPTVLGIMPYAGVAFFVYESLKKSYHLKYPDQELLVHYRLLYGAFAGVCGQSLSYPMDIVRRRMQTDGIDGKGYKYRRFLYTIKYVYRTEGIVKGYFKGMSINWIKGPIAVGISFSAFDTIKKCLEFLLGESEAYSW